MFKKMEMEEIQEQINWLRDDNHSLMRIIQDPTADAHTVQEAKYRVSANREEICRLNDQLDILRKGEKVS